MQDSRTPDQIAEGRAELPYDGMVDLAAMAVASTGSPPDPGYLGGQERAWRGL